MEKLSKKQTPNYAEMRKTLVGLGNVLVQAGLADEISFKVWESIGILSFSCGMFSYHINSDNKYNEEEYLAFLDSMKDYMRKMVADYEEQIFTLECAKAVMEVYLTDNK